MSAIVRDLFVYPIKSFRGVRLSTMRVEDMGPAHDRQFVLVDGENRLLTQRQLPELARIGVRILDESVLELSADGFGEMDFGLGEHVEATESVTVWKDPVPAQEVNPEVSEWLGGVLKRKVRLLRMAENARRIFDYPGGEGVTRFTDAAPALVISSASLLQLEQRAGVQLSMSRFRPNIVVDGVPAHAEDGWPGFSIGPVRFAPYKPCGRCKVTTVHPLTGAVGEEPLKTLATYRRGDKGIVFGMYYVHLASGTVHFGSPVVVSETSS